MFSLQGLQDKLQKEQLRVPTHFNKVFQNLLPKMIVYEDKKRISFFELAK
jgi:hypothetical protein